MPWSSLPRSAWPRRRRRGGRSNSRGPSMFRLRRNLRISVAFAGGGQEEFGVFGQRETECVVSAQRADLQSLDGHFQIIDRAGRRSEVQDVVHGAGNIDVVGDVRSRNAETRVPLEMSDIRVHAGNQIVERENVPSLRVEAIAKMCTQSTS